MMMEVICKKIMAVAVLVSTAILVDAQVYISDFKTAKTQKYFFSAYTLSFETYREEDGDVYVEEFKFDIEFPEPDALDATSKKAIEDRIKTLAFGDASADEPEKLLNANALSACASRYEGKIIKGDSECQNFVSAIKAKNSSADSDLFWEPSYYGKITGKLIYQTNSFVSYSLTKEDCNAMTCLRNETTFVYDIINHRFIIESDFVTPAGITTYSDLIKNAFTREQRITYNKSNINFNGNFYIDEYGITYVFNSDKYLDDFESKIHVRIDPKSFRSTLKQESIVYKFFNIGQVERVKAKKQNKPVTM